MSRRLFDQFSASSVEKISKIIGDTHYGLSGSEIGILLAASTIRDVDGPQQTKWRRIGNALHARQTTDRCGNAVIRFITETMRPIRYHDSPDQFHQLRNRLNEVLIFDGLRVNEDGRVAKATGGPAKTLQEAQQRAGTVISELKRRKAHATTLEYCTAEIFAKDNFHAVLEATKSIAERLRSMTSLTSDGAQLADDTLLPKNSPLVAINGLATETELSEQSGFANVVKGIMGMYRNPTAHIPRLLRTVTDEELYEAFATISMIHRRLDMAIVGHAPQQ